MTLVAFSYRRLGPFSRTVPFVMDVEPRVLNAALAVHRQGKALSIRALG